LGRRCRSSTTLRARDRNGRGRTRTWTRLHAGGLGPRLPRADLAENRREVFALERLLLDERLGQLVERRAMGAENVPRLVVRVIDQRPDFGVDAASHFVGVDRLVTQVAP